MRTVTAYFNYGRWLVDCPKHGKEGINGVAGVAEVTKDNPEFIAPCCYPNVIAGFPGMVKGQIKYIIDKSSRRTAISAARENDDIYTAIFPDEVPPKKTRTKRTEEK